MAKIDASEIERVDYIHAVLDGWQSIVETNPRDLFTVDVRGVAVAFTREEVRAWPKARSRLIARLSATKTTLLAAFANDHEVYGWTCSAAEAFGIDPSKRPGNGGHQKTSDRATCATVQSTQVWSTRRKKGP